MALHEYSREQGFEICCGGGRRKNKFGTVHRVRLICAKGVKHKLGKSSGSRPSIRPRRCIKLTDRSRAVMVYAENIQNSNGSIAKWLF